MQERFYTSADGLSLFFRDYADAGEGKAPVFCLPGLTRNSKDFSELAEHLSSTRRVICPEFRGRGNSERDPNYLNYQPATYAQDVIQLCDELRFEKIIIVGTSLGGLVAMIVAMLRPGLLAGVVLNDVGPKLEAEGIARIQSYVGKGQPVRNWADAAREVKRLNEAAHPGRPDDFWQAYARRVCKENAEGVPEFDYDSRIGDALRDTPPADPEAGWIGFAALQDIPVLVTRGESSDILSQETIDEMRVRKPDLLSVDVVGAGHAPMLNEPESLKAIEQLLAKVG